MSERFVIDKASCEDLVSIARAESNIFTDPWSMSSLLSSFEDEHFIFISAKSGDGDLIGYAIGSCAAGEAELLRIAVLPSARQLGLGRRILEYFINLLREEADTIFLEVRESNIAARKLYIGVGFVEYSTRRNYYKNPNEDAVMMRLDLDA